jgi:predicted tellurium resistance membrane protein TerC
MLEWVTNPAVWMSFFTLSVLEIVLGIDNIIFLSILSGRLPKNQQQKARMIGLSLALIMRVALLSCIAALTHMNQTLFSLFDHDFAWRDLIMFGGGAFLLYKATAEIHAEIEGEEEEDKPRKPAGMGTTVAQIVAIDLVFSLDSIFTAVGVAEHLPVMIAAIIVAIAIMMFASGPVSDFVNEHPSIKMLALSFLLMVGSMLIADSFHFHIPRGYLYFSIAFSLGTEALSLISKKKKAKKKHLHGPGGNA